MTIFGESTISRRSLLKAAGIMGMGSGLEANAGTISSFADSAMVSGDGLKRERFIDADQAIKTYCSFCKGRCGAIAYIKNGKLLGVTGRPDDPRTKGKMCAIGLSAAQLVNSPTRLKYPMKRVGERGEGKWQRITWDEALNTIVDKMNKAAEKYGKETVVFYGGSSSGSPFGEWRGWFQRLAYVWGTPNYGSMSSHICGSYPTAVWKTVAGAGTSPDYENAKCILLWGCNPLKLGAPGGDAETIVDALERGVKLIVVDPLFTGAASKANIWAPLRPGSDGALALGMMNVIINENLYDHDFCANWTVGFDDLKKYVQEFTPKKVAEITWVPEDKIIAMARTYATTKPACLEFGVKGLGAHSNSVQNTRAVIMLSALTGNLDIPGGNCFGSSPSAPITPVGCSTSLLPKGMLEKGLPWKHKLYRNFTPPTFYHACNTGQPHTIQCYIGAIGGGLMVDSDTSKAREAFLKIPFISNISIIMDPTSEIADILLPAATCWESEYVRGGKPPAVMLRRAVVQPPGECWDDLKFVFELAKRLGVGDMFYNGDIKAALDELLKPTKTTIDELKKTPEGIKILSIPYEPKYYTYKENKFQTPSGKVEFSSDTIKGCGQSPLPEYVEPYESPYSQPELAKKYPLVFGTGHRSHVYCHAQMRQVPWLREVEPYPRVFINPAKARELGIADGEWVIIENLRGSIKMKACYFEGIHPNVVSAEHGWWKGCDELNMADYGWGRSIGNKLCFLEPQDPLHGCTNHLSMLCKVRKALEV